MKPHPAYAAVGFFYGCFFKFLIQSPIAAQYSPNTWGKAIKKVR